MEGNPINISPGALATLKVVDKASNKPVLIQKIRFKNGVELSEKYQPGIVGYYYYGSDFGGPAVKHTDSMLWFEEKAYSTSDPESGLKKWPAEILNITDPRNDSFSVKYEGFIKVEEAANYTFYLSSDDWAQLYINGNLVIKDPKDRNEMNTKNKTIFLSAGYHPIKVEFKEYKGTSVLHLKWASPSISKCFVEAFYHEVS